MRLSPEAREGGTRDELGVLEHPPVYTVGIAGRAEHLPKWGTIQVRRIDRGGQITYHGLGQAIVYALLDLSRRRLTVRGLVSLLEQSVIDCLASHGVEGARRPGAPGVYVGGAKVAALGLRVRRGGCYHGVALNVDMDLAPYLAIDPCGYPGLAVTQTRSLGIDADVDAMGGALAQRIAELLDENHAAR